MNDDRGNARDVDQFILHYVDSVPHLEALLLLWRTRPRHWSAVELATALYLQPRETESIAQDLVRADLIAALPEGYSYSSDDAEKDGLISAVDAAYKRETVRLSTLIHSRGSRAVRDFAQSFRLKKKEQ